MNGKNAKFGGDPAGFLDNHIVNMSAFLGEDSDELKKHLNLINNSKAGAFDFQDWKSNVKIRFAGGAGKVVNDMPILGYFCPFIQGESEPPGWVDVPRSTPLHQFVFTPTMNGCAFVITDSPTAGHFRVHHHQHPVGPERKTEIACAGATRELDRFSEAEYDIGSTKDRVKNAKFFGTFNFLHMKGADWYFVSQASEWSALGQGDSVEWTRPANAKVVTRKVKTL